MRARHGLYALLAALAPAFGAISPCCAEAASGSPQFAIVGLEAKLFYANSGRFSANVLGDPDFA